MLAQAFEERKLQLADHDRQSFFVDQIGERGENLKLLACQLFAVQIQILHRFGPASLVTFSAPFCGQATPISRAWLARCFFFFVWNRIVGRHRGSRTFEPTIQIGNVIRGEDVIIFRCYVVELAAGLQVADHLGQIVQAAGRAVLAQRGLRLPSRSDDLDESMCIVDVAGTSRNGFRWLNLMSGLVEGIG